MLTKRELEAYCGDVSQQFGIRECVLTDGKAKGTKACQVWNGKGLEMTVLPDKCFAVPEMRFQGINVGFISKAGICAPEFYQEEGTRGFLRNFEAGFLTTCGLTYMGTPGVEDGQANGLHGVISNTPAEHKHAGVDWDGDTAWITFGGHAREGYLFGPNLAIHRNFRVSTEENKIWIHDIVENKGFEESPLMILYHFNLGYPMLDESCRIYSNMDQIAFRDDTAKKGKDNINVFQKPTIGFEEEVYFRTTKNPEETQGFAVVHNENLKKAVALKFNPRELPVLNQWKSPRSGDYALGLEPGTAHVGGRIRAKEEGILQYIGAGEKREFELEVEFIDCVTENEKLNAFINKLI